jgi:hypothetical protein
MMISRLDSVCETHARHEFSSGQGYPAICASPPTRRYHCQPTQTRRSVRLGCWRQARTLMARADGHTGLAAVMNPHQEEGTVTPVTSDGRPRGRPGGHPAHLGVAGPPRRARVEGPPLVAGSPRGAEARSFIASGVAGRLDDLVLHQAGHGRNPQSLERASFLASTNSSCARWYAASASVKPSVATLSSTRNGPNIRTVQRLPRRPVTLRCGRRRGREPFRWRRRLAPPPGWWLCLAATPPAPGAGAGGGEFPGRSSGSGRTR